MADVSKLLITDEMKKRIEYTTRNSIIILEKVNKLALQSGWFYDLQIMTELIIEKLIEKELKQIDEIFINFFSKEINNIKQKSIERFPERRSILEKAFKAHKNQDYEVSIILFLTQIDGIFNEISQMNLFSGEKSNYNAAKWIKELKNNGKNPAVIAVLSALKETKLLSLNFDDGLDYPNVVCRNRILHGRELKFGTKINSLKVISMLNFITITIYNLVYKKKLIDD